MVSLLALLTALTPPPMCGAAGPEVVRVRVPAKDLTRYFPPGTELRILSPEQFEAAVSRAARDSAGRRAVEPARLIVARHRARLEGGLLRGRSELVVGGGPSGPFNFPMEPWTPAIRVGIGAGAAPAVGASENGTTVLRITGTPGGRAIPIEWEQQPRPLSRGRGFALGLPAVDTTVLELELPEGWSASSQRGVRRGPIPTGDPGWSLWELDGEGGRFDVELSEATDRGKSGANLGAWLSASTEVDIRQRPGRSASMANWTSECRLELDPRHAARLEAELDPGLELIDVRGNALRGYRIDRPGESTRVVISIAEGVRATTLRLMAHATVPTEGTWRIPAFHPVDAIWTGGRTTVLLDESHAVRGYRERAGRLVPSARGDDGPDDRLAFESRAPKSVAELVLVQPRPGLACTVRGQLDLSGTPARFEARLDWALRRGSVSELVVDLSPGWSPDQVRIQGLDDPLTWHSSPSPSGGIRLRAMLPASVLASGKWTLTIGATAGGSLSRGPLELPRVQPVGTSVVDEAWIAWTDDASTIRPVRARGLAWIEPDDVPGLATPAPSPGLFPALGWRWTAAADGDPEARIDRERVDRTARASIRARARLSPDGRGLSIDGTMFVEAGGAPLDAIPIGLEGSGDPLAAWQFRGEDSAVLRPRRVGEIDRVRLGFGRDISAREIPVDLLPHGRRSIAFQATLAWSSPGSIPLLRIAPGSIEPSTIRVEVPAAMRTRFEMERMGRLHTETTRETFPTGPDAGPIVRTFTYDEPGAQLKLTAEPMEPGQMPGIVREAWMTTTWDGPGRTLNRLRMLVQPGRSDELSIEMPPDSKLVRVQRDGGDILPIRSGSRLGLPVPSAGGGAARPNLYVLDYVMETGPDGDGSILRPNPPKVDRPCLSFDWEISVPSGWRLVDPVGGLAAIESDDLGPWPAGILGIRPRDWSLPLGRGTPGPLDGLALLDGRLGRPPADELSFSEWFARWDAGPWPILLDRVALGSAGLGPRSPCLPGRLPPENRDSAEALLAAHGLAAIRFDGILLITTKAERPRFETRSAWARSIAEAVAWGADQTDRFQSVERWRGEVSPRVSASSETDSTALWSTEGRCPGRFSSPGWPAIGSSVRIVDLRQRRVIGWMVAGLVAITGMAWSRRSRSGGLLAPALVVGAALVIEPTTPSRFSSITAGALVGSFTVLIVTIARRCRRSSVAVPAPNRAESSMIRAAAGASVVALLAVAALAPRPASARDDPPILAIFPYEGAYDPVKAPDRVVLRLDDYQRLTHRSPVAEAQTEVVAIASGHRVTRKEAGDVLVETEIELAARGGPGPFAWLVPVASAREMTAMIGGETVPIAVEPGGENARILLPGPGNYLLSLRRWAAARLDESGAEVLSLPINATPTARLVVAPPTDAIGQGVAVTRGRMGTTANGTLDGRLGPCNRLIVRWTPARPVRPEIEPGAVGALMLWDVTPAGDRVRARLTYHRADDITSVRLAHDPGVILRSARVAGVSRVLCELEPGKDEWVVSFDPPLPPSATIVVEYWKPAASLDIDDGEPPGHESARSFPKIHPVGGERLSGVLGVRRPGDWTGRLTPDRDTVPIDDEAFVKAWGPLPDEPLTFCGTERIGPSREILLETGPARPRIAVRPAVQVRIEAGRLIVAADAEIEATELPPVLEAVLPPGLHVTQIQGDGLIDWIVTGERKINLTWHRRGARSRRALHLLGWIATDEDPLAVPPRRPAVRTPWIDWPGAEVGPATLVVFGPTNAEIRGGSGLAPSPLLPSVPSTALARTEVVSRPRLSYFVEDAEHLGELSWDPRPPQVSVVVESRLTVDTNQARWVAVIRYDVLGGGLDRINLKIPASWAAQARLSVPGEENPGLPHVIGPSAFWSIATSGSSFWGPHRLVLRASMPIGSAREWNYPDVAPLGHGSVDTYLEIVNATGQSGLTEEATGLQAIARTGRFRGREFEPVGGTPGGAYWVKKPWALRIQWPRANAEPIDPDGEARAELAAFAVTVLTDGSAIGRGLYEIRPGGGRLLTVALPAGASILWASLEPDPVVPLRAGPWSWSIPIDPRRAGRVCVVWQSPPNPPNASGSRSLLMPSVGVEATPAFVRIAAPKRLVVRSKGPALQAMTALQYDTRRAEWLGRSISESLAFLDRGSARDRDGIIALLIDQELTLRAVDRGTGRKPEPPPPPGLSRADSIAVANQAVSAAVRNAGLGDELDAALDYLGLASDSSHRPAGGLPEPVASSRIRALGQPYAFVGSLPAPNDPQPAALSIETRKGLDLLSANNLLYGVALLLTLAGAWLGGHPSPKIAVVALSAILTASWVVAGILALGAGVILAVGAAIFRP